MDLHRLDLEVAIYRNRVQVTHRGTDTFVDQRADFPFSSEEVLVAHPRQLEDALIRAIRQILGEGGFALRHPIAHIVGAEGKLGPADRAMIELALRETGMREVVFELDE